MELLPHFFQNIVPMGRQTLLLGMVMSGMLMYALYRGLKRLRGVRV